MPEVQPISKEMQTHRVWACPKEDAACTRKVRYMSRERFAERFWNRVDTSGECWIWQGNFGKDGYGSVRDRGRRVGAHRVAYELTGGPIPDGLLVCHTCDNPPCVRPDHLFVGSPADNTKDCWDKGRAPWQTAKRSHAFGEAVAGARLTARDVVAIRARHSSGESALALAAEFGVSHTAIGRVVHRQTWRHI